MMRRTAHAVGAAAMLSSLALYGCNSSQETPATTEAASTASTETDDAAITRTTEEGPIKATVTLRPGLPRLGDSLTLELEVEAQAGVTFELPAFGEALGRFSIVDYTPRESRADDGTQIASQTYTLQAPMSGLQRIPQLRIEYVDQRDPDSPDRDRLRELMTEELTIEIVSVLPDGEVTDELRPERGPLPPRATDTARGWWWLLLPVMAAAAFLLFRSLRDKARRRARISAYDKALERLTTLERGGLPEADAADAWYVELSAIVRRYLEDRFAVRAPELTTEEFLREARRSRELGDDHRELLSDFLERCDRVKFAGYVPQEAESREAIAAAHRFLDETRSRAGEERPTAREQAA